MPFNSSLLASTLHVSVHWNLQVHALQIRLSVQPCRGCSAEKHNNDAAPCPHAPCNNNTTKMSYKLYELLPTALRFIVNMSLKGWENFNHCIPTEKLCDQQDAGIVRESRKVSSQQNWWTKTGISACSAVTLQNETLCITAHFYNCHSETTTLHLQHRSSRSSFFRKACSPLLLQCSKRGKELSVDL